jgi:GNAT superfamily N-acetyltransferase
MSTSDVMDDSQSIEIEFRNTRQDGAANFWYVEAYKGGRMFPVGTAYVVAVGNVAQLNFILVADQWRRQGVGTALINAIRDRWPDYQATLPMGDEATIKFAVATQSPATVHVDKQ